jgi:hypothetical protein
MLGLHAVDRHERRGSRSTVATGRVSHVAIDERHNPFSHLTASTWLLILAAMGSLLVGLVIPGTSYVLLCVSIAFSGAALLSRAATRRREEDETSAESLWRPRAAGVPHDPALEKEDKRWDGVLAASWTSGEQHRSAGGEMTPSNTPAQLHDVAAELVAQIRAELDAVRSELRQSASDRDAAVLRRIEELVGTSQNGPERLEAALASVHEAVVELRDGLASGSARDIDGQLPFPAAGEQLEAAISRLTAAAGSVGTLAEIEVVIETSMHDLRSAVSSLSERLDKIPVALRAELGASLASVQTGVSQLRESVEPKVDDLLVQAESRRTVNEDLSAQLSELRRGVDALATLEGSARELRTAVASVSEHVRSLDAAVQASEQRQAGLAEHLTALKDEVTRLAKGVGARAKRVRLEDGPIEALAEAVVAAAPRPRPTEKASSAAPRAVEAPSTAARATKARTTRVGKTSTAKTVAQSKTVRTPRPRTQTGGSKRMPVKTTATNAGVKKAIGTPERSSPARRAPSSRRTERQSRESGQAPDA